MGESIFSPIRSVFAWFAYFAVPTAFSRSKPGALPNSIETRRRGRIPSGDQCETASRFAITTARHAPIKRWRSWRVASPWAIGGAAGVGCRRAERPTAANVDLPGADGTKPEPACPTGAWQDPEDLLGWNVVSERRCTGSSRQQVLQDAVPLEIGGPLSRRFWSAPRSTYRRKSGCVLPTSRTQEAVIRNFEAIGEAKTAGPDIRAHPELPSANGRVQGHPHPRLRPGGRGGSPNIVDKEVPELTAKIRAIRDDGVITDPAAEGGRPIGFAIFDLRF